MTENKPEEAKKGRTIKKYTFKGMDIEQLMGLTDEQLIEQFPARIRRRFRHGLNHKYACLMMKLRKAKKNLQQGEKPTPVKTHLRNAIVTPEMVGSIVAIHCGNGFTNVEIRFDMIGRYLAEFAITYKPTKHGKPGIGATKGSSHVAKT